MFDLTTVAAEGGVDLAALRVGELAPRFGAALVIGTVLAVRPWRYVMGRPPPRPEMAQAQILLCVAATIITIVIGNSLAKAFGLVGLGSFVRFRSGLKDPRDAAVLFLVIGLGMACGHGSLPLAFSGAAFACVLLAGLDLFKVPDAPAAPEAEARHPGATPIEIRPAPAPAPSKEIA
ncbi:DUF4956 domain-containing protein [Anaeromyxobacter terrae]|uniref:DUF4956 domain-containing protein n=1 Tax=Anaeromyxobacter terrae TaxID=2925406 RepID=UPI002FCCC68B